VRRADELGFEVFAAPDHLGFLAPCAGLAVAIHLRPRRLRSCVGHDIAVYCPDVSSDVWIGAATTLSGAALGGAISFVLNRQQAKDARSQRADQAQLDRHRRSIERRFGAYADFDAHVRAFRNALRPYGYQPVPRLAMDDISALARAAHGASSLVFLTVELPETDAAARHVIRTMSDIQGILDDQATAPDAKPWPQLNERMAAAVRRFEEAARNELEVTGPGPAN